MENQDRFDEQLREPVHFEVQRDERNRDRENYRPNRKYKPVHSWPIRFNGETGLSLMDFLDQAEMLQVAECISTNELYSSIIHLLTGRAYEWFRSNYRNMHSWDEFKQQIVEEFIPENYEHMLLWEIETRAQGKNEAFGSYLCAMKRLFQCLSTPLTEAYKLYVVRKGLSSLYAMHLATAEIRTLEELARLCKRIDSTRMMLHRQKCINVSRDSLLEPDLSCPNKSSQRPQVHAVSEETDEETPEVSAFVRKTPAPKEQNKAKTQANSTATSPNEGARDSRIRCWNCDVPGHHFHICSKPRRGLFCYKCGEKDIILRNCPRCNGSRTAVQETENSTNKNVSENPTADQS